MREWLMPRRLSSIKLDGDALVEPAGRRVIACPGAGESAALV